MKRKPHKQHQSQNIAIQLPRLHPAQQQVVAEAARFNVLCAGRRTGKTVMGIDRLVQPALHGYPVSWMSPTYRMLTEVWRNAKAHLMPVVVALSEQQHRIELITGGTIEMWSLEQPDTIRGRKYRCVVIDEAAMVRDLATAWQQVIRPTLTDMKGEAWMLSSPRGRNFFWECFQRGIDANEPDWMAWQMPTSVNPHIAPDEIAAMQRELPEQVYRQEIEAQFLDTSGSVFRRVLEAATAEPQEEPVDGHSYVIGVDWARSGDFSCFVVMDSTTHTMVWLDRFTNVAFDIQMTRLRALYERFRPTTIVAEQNSLGLPLVEQLGREGYPIQGLTTTNASKAAWIDALVLAFEQDEITILNESHLIEELLVFEMERLPSGMVRYAAPPGHHDDTVMALALAWQGCQTGSPLMLW